MTDAALQHYISGDESLSRTVEILERDCGCVIVHSNLYPGVGFPTDGNGMLTVQSGYMLDGDDNIVKTPHQADEINPFRQIAMFTYSPEEVVSITRSIVEHILEADPTARATVEMMLALAGLARPKNEKTQPFG